MGSCVSLWGDDDPHYVSVHWLALPSPPNWTAAGGDLATLNQRADRLGTSLPIQGGQRAIRIVVPGNYDILLCSSQAVAGTVAALLQERYPNQAIAVVTNSRSRAEVFP